MVGQATEIRERGPSTPPIPVPGRSDAFSPRPTERTTPAALAFVAATLAGGIGLILAVRHLAPGSSAVGPIDDLSYRVDSSALAIALLVVAALWTRHRGGPDGLNIHLMSMMVVTAAVIVPADLALGSDPNLGGLVIGSRLALVGVGVSILLGARSTRTPRLRRVVWIPAIVLVVGALIEMAIVRLGAESRSVATAGLGLSAGSLVLLSLPLGALGLRRRIVRIELLALTMLAFGVADSVAFGMGEASMATLAGKSVRTVLLGSWLLVTLVELLEVALSERHQAERATEELDEATIKLLEQLRRHEQVVHDVRNALFAIRGGLRSLDRSGLSDPILPAISSEVDRLRNTLEDLTSRDLPVPFDVARAIAPMVDCYRSLSVDVSFTVDGPCVANARESTVMEIVQNLLDNAVKYGGGEVAVWVLGNDERVSIRVGDRGPGVSPSRRASIFDRHGSTGNSTGVGLHIARRLAESQGGDLTAIDREGGGSVFTLDLPVAGVVEHA